VLPACRRAREVAGRRAGASWLLAAAAFAGAANVGLPSDGTSGTVGEDLARQVLFGALALFLVAPVALGRSDSPLVVRLLGLPVVAAVGTVSYGVFLWHFDWVEQLVEWGALDWWPAARTPTVLALAGALALATAALSWVVLERPLLRGRRAAVRAVGR
jgi:peptidoglycan/LPS O-acetylase OafA/YrhL